MKAVCILSLLGWTAAASAAPHPASKKDREKLEGAIKAIETVRNEDAASGQGIMQKIELKIGARDENGLWLRPSLVDPNYFVVTTKDMDRELKQLILFDANVAVKFRELPDEDMAAYAIAAQAHKRYQEALRPLCAEALVLAEKAFGLSPRVKEGLIVNGPPPPKSDDDFPSFLGRRAVWKPAYHETQDPNNRGFTDPDGRVGITLEAFRDADRLGFVLYHEGLHFGQLLSGPNSKNEPEEEARHREKAKLVIGTVFKLKPEDAAANDKVLGEERKNAKKWRQRIAAGFDPWKKSHRPHFSGNYKSLWMKSSTDEDESLPASYEPAVLQADLGFIDAWRRETAAWSDRTLTARDVAAADARARLEHEERARVETERRKQEIADAPERERRQFRAAVEFEAEQCGYRVGYHSDGETITGFHGIDDSSRFPFSRHWVPWDFGDIKVVFLMTRVCGQLESRPNEPAPPACNGAAELLHERVGRGDFLPKLEYLAAGPSGMYPLYSYCLQELMASWDKIRDAKSFDKVVAKYQKQLIKRLKRDAKIEERIRRNRERGPAQPPPRERDSDPGHKDPDHDEVWRRIERL